MMMDASSDWRSDSTLDGRHLAAIDAARRQFEKASPRHASSAASNRAKAHNSDWLSDALPGYDIGSEIHRGGQGVVYRSIQRGTQREVAIKVMREGPFGGPREKARFEREIQILGSLRHPNIVTIHESGESANGVFFVMDYIPGRTLDAYVADAKLNVRDTLKLMSRVCHAVHVAHLRGVIHRDLKPANIRVDDRGDPHVLDFGLAKLNEAGDFPEGSAAPVESMTGQFIGSLPWASPEQLEGKSGDVDIRTDVYALGVVTFQVLTGRMPYDITGNFRQVIDSICRIDPPSARTLRPDIDDEVDAILRKCLRKGKDERYQSAGDVARDIDRYLAGEPIEAKRGSGWYMFAKQLRRHRTAVTVAAMFLLVITAGLITSLTFWRQAVKDRDATKAALADVSEARDEARRQEETAKAVTGFLTQDVLLKLDPYNTNGEELTARALFDEAARDVEAGAFGDQPRVEFEVRTVLGLVALWRSDFAAAEAQFRPALEIARKELGSDHERTLLTMSRLGTVLSRLGKLSEAEPILRESFETQTRLRGDDNPATLMARSSLAGWCLDAGKPEEAETLCRKLLEIRTRLQGVEASDTLAVMSKLAESLMVQEKFEEAEALFRECISLKRKVHGDRHPETLLDLMHYANMLQFQGRKEEAMPIAREAYDGLRERLGPSSESAQSALVLLADLEQSAGNWSAAEELYRGALKDYRSSGGSGYSGVWILLQLASNLSQRGKMKEAEENLREALAMHDRVGGKPDVRMQILSLLVSVLGEQGRSEDAIAPAAECLKLGREVYGEDAYRTMIFVNNYAFALMGAGRADEAAAQFRAALAVMKQAGEDDDALALNMKHNLAIALGKAGAGGERETLLREVVSGRRRIHGDNDPYTLKSIHALATELRDRGKLEEARSLFQEALDRAEKVWPDGHFMVEHYRRGLGVCLMEMKRFEEAEPLLVTSQANDLKLLPEGHPNRIEGIEKLILLYEEWGKPEQAAAWRAKLPASEEQNEADEPATP